MGRGERSSTDKGTVHWEQLDIQSVFNVNVYKELDDKTQQGGVLLQQGHLFCKDKLKINKLKREKKHKAEPEPLKCGRRDQASAMHQLGCLLMLEILSRSPNAVHGNDTETPECCAASECSN